VEAIIQITMMTISIIPLGTASMAGYTIATSIGCGTEALGATNIIPIGRAIGLCGQFTQILHPQSPNQNLIDLTTPTQMGPIGQELRQSIDLQ
jgi:hypothetical protein